MADPGLLERTVIESGLIDPGSKGVVLLSGGPDSVALLWALSRLLGPEGVEALHVNYGLRRDSDLDEASCRSLCRELGVDLGVVEAGPPEGNLHDWARTVRYREAGELARGRDLDWIAVGHTRTDLVETVLYRLASSPGTRALRAMPARRGRVVRPLLAIGRAEVRSEVESIGLGFVDDPSNLDPAFARARIRSGVIPVLGEVNPSFERNVARTLEELDEEAVFLEAEASALLIEGPNGQPALGAGEFTGLSPALGRHALRVLLSRTTGRVAPVSIERTALVRDLASRPEGGSADFGDGLTLVIGSGLVLAEEDTTARSGTVRTAGRLSIPGTVGWEGWLFGAERVSPEVRPQGPDVAALDPAGLGGSVGVRAWRPGDRMRPLGMDGTRKVADLMAERRLPRPRRQEWPVVEVAGEIAWVPGVAVSEAFRSGPETECPVLLTAEPPGRSGATAVGPDT